MHHRAVQELRPAKTNEFSWVATLMGYMADMYIITPRRLPSIYQQRLLEHRSLSREHERKRIRI